MSNKSVLSRQNRLFGAGFVGLLMIISVLGYLFFDDGKSKSFADKKAIDLPSDKIDTQEIWMHRIEGENKLLEQKLKYLEEILLDNKRKEASYEQEKESLKKELSTLSKKLQEPQRTSLAPSVTSRDPFIPSPNETVLPIIKPPLVELIVNSSASPLAHVDKTIPSGTSVKALLISSVDATCGVYAPSDPIPVKLRILDNAHLPKEVEVKLKGGILIGSAYGNLSSERVYMRLERLTQVKIDGSFVETQVAGYISGEDGKYGVRGVTVDKSRQIVLNAASSGALSQLGNILQSLASSPKVQYDNYSLNSDTLKQSAIGGTSNAFDTLADYYLKRAEQIQPVIQVTAGRVVDVTFTHGADVGDLHTQDKVREIRKSSPISMRSLHEK